MANDKQQKPMATMPQVTIIDDDRPHAEALLWLLESQGYSVRSFQDAATFLMVLEPSAHEILLMDVNMPEMDGLQLLENIREQGAIQPVIMISAFGTLKNGVHAMKLGAVEFLEKPLDNVRVLEAVAAASTVADERYMQSTNKQEVAQKLAALTPREREVFELITQGHTNKVVADRLDITDKTVEAHRASLIRKLGAGSLSGLMSLKRQLKTGELETP